MSTTLTRPGAGNRLRLTSRKSARVQRTASEPVDAGLRERARRLVDLRIDYIPHPEFEAIDAFQRLDEILAGLEVPPPRRRLPRQPRICRPTSPVCTLRRSSRPRPNETCSGQ